MGAGLAAAFWRGLAALVALRREGWGGCLLAGLGGFGGFATGRLGYQLSELLGGHGFHLNTSAITFSRSASRFLSA